MSDTCDRPKMLPFTVPNYGMGVPALKPKNPAQGEAFGIPMTTEAASNDSTTDQPNRLKPRTEPGTSQDDSTIYENPGATTMNIDQRVTELVGYIADNSELGWDQPPDDVVKQLIKDVLKPEFDRGYNFGKLAAYEELFKGGGKYKIQFETDEVVIVIPRAHFQLLKMRADETA